MPTPHLPPSGRHPSLAHVTTWVEEENTTNYQRAPRRRIQTFNSEASVQQRVADYLRLRYPRALWRSDYASGLKLSMAQAAQHKRLQSGRGWPDLQITEPSADGLHHALYIELKREGVVVYKKDGSLRSDPHLEEQAAVLALLRDRGCKAEFACGFDEAVRLIDVYLTGRTSQC